ncbi:3-oxoacyl-[acyl-carrier protein] reductase [Sinobaca qinghaiensis]|uniref:3-oxoacyl-[acyl-carrier protein] reductase n=1 Tax=Sinobaca qinghaiensis TaxID=342944 RepID=A0A419V953_9BACL|nr:SDR family oxidoreductase [Sinobaca qinghaiensis]RKD76540.1 3-oxoacyl-[acyl-carrier protein] reductase [Sinobaca qinghaiensis]
MDLGLKGKAVVVLASSKGLGFAAASLYAQEGANVMLAGREEESLAEAAAAVKGGGSVYWHVCDVTKPEDIKQLMKEAENKLGGIDVLVNNTGGPPAGDFEDMEDEDWQYAFELTLFSYIRAIRAALPLLKKSRGRIVNIASSSIKQPVDHLLLSNTFRSGIAGFSKSLAIEFAPHGILINTVGPGRIETGRTTSLLEKTAAREGVTFEKAKQQSEASIPLGRYGLPEEFARQVVFLGSPANSYTTGQIILVEGGAVSAY